MERKDIDWNVVVTQTAKAGSADLYAMMPWAARLPVVKPDNRPVCEGISFGQGRRCKRRATLLHIDVNGSVHYFCATHLHDERMSKWHVIGALSEEGDPHVNRAEKWFDKHSEWSEQHKADIAAYNAQFEEVS
jgi:hypothetical protein